MGVNVGLIGKLGSGKTFAANYLCDKYNFVRLSLAQPIKDIMAEYFGVMDKTNPRYRGLAQKIGTDWFRSEDPDVWVKNLIHRANVRNDVFAQSVVCDDVRFVNEASTLLNQSWVMIYLDCPDEIRMERCKKRDGVFDASLMNHPSETGVDDILKLFGSRIYTVNSSGTIEETNKQLDIILQRTT